MYTSPPYAFLKLSHQPDFTLETFAILFISIWSFIIYSTKQCVSFATDKTLFPIEIGLTEIVTNGYRLKFESKSNKTNCRITCKRLDLIKQLQFNNKLFSRFTLLQNTCQCLKMDQF